MKLVPSLLGMGVLALLAGPAAAQDPDKEAVKKKILQEVEKRIRQEEDRLLKEIERIIDDELSRPKKPAPGAVPPPPAPPEFLKPPPAPLPRKTRGYLGIRAADLDPEERKGLGIKGGFKIQEIMPGSPAEKAGLKVEDVVVAIDGREVDTAQDVRIVVAAAGAGATLNLDILRGGKKQSIKATLARHPEEGPTAEPEPPKREEPKAGDLRERVKKFLEKGEEKKPEPPKPETPKAEPKSEPKAKKDGPFDKLFDLDEETYEQFKKAFEPLGVDLEQFLEKGGDGRYRLKGDFAEMFRDLQKNFGLQPGEEAPGEETPKEKPKPAGRPWLGIQAEELSEELRSQLDVAKDTGLLVAEVLPGSPAEKAGLKKHDVLLRIDGKPVKGEETLSRFMEGAKVGQEAAFVILRKSKEQTLKATLVPRKD